ncbi:MAG: hypothetical protein EXX96DRAFT_491710 [Benjaminiella poitrasii]|nr:MAG: hypothetical protein EXX96DRAFT_491710 [Benjaminiella poitrasii]
MSSISDNNNISKENSSRKRTRATPEQLAILEKTFVINPSPNNRLREQLSHQLNMSERSIQIWFQNRRAKVKNVAKRNSMLHDEMLRMQYYASTAAAAAFTVTAPTTVSSFPPPLSLKSMPLPPPPPPPPSSTNAPLSGSTSPHYPTIMMTPTTPSLFNTTTHNLQQQPHYYTMLTNNNKQQQPIQRISAEVLQIGTWKRMAFTPNDLLCQYDKENKLFSWCIQDGLSKFKMEFSETMIESIKFAPLPARPGWARLEMHILSAESISFYMKQENGWVQCRDFTEDIQASSALLHQLDGPAFALKAELDLLTKDNPSLLITQ